MEKRLFLTGPAGSGKTQLIRMALGEKLALAGGFVTECAYGSDSYIMGYELRPAAAAAGIDGFESRRFLDSSVWPPQKDNEVFRGYGVQLLREALYYPFVVLDMIGGIEMILPQFRSALEELLNSDVPILGAIKPLRETAQLGQLFGLGERFDEKNALLIEALNSDSGTLFLDLDKCGKEAALPSLLRWVEAYAN